MIWFALQTMAQLSVERILNALPEGFLIAFFAWALLLVLPRQNSGTRFAVWFVALLAVAALPLLSSVGQTRAPFGTGISSGSSWGRMGPAITIPARWAIFAFLAWGLGTGITLLRLAAGLWHVWQLRRNCTAIVVANLDPAVRRTIDAIGASGSTAAGSIAIATSQAVRVPAAIGFWRRTIVLPSWALRELSSNDLNVILLHEFAHLRRGDDWTNLIQKMVRALLFFHPAVWWIDRRLAVEREMACDDAVLAETANPRGYANCLVSLLEKSLAHRFANRLAEKRCSMAQAAVHRSYEASLRLARILDHNRPAATRIWKPALGMIGALSAICVAAMPLAPQFVAFDRRAAGSDPGHAFVAAQSQPALQTLPAMPAALWTNDSVSPRTPRKSVRAHSSDGNSLDWVPVVGARLQSSPPRARAIEVSTSADQAIAPEPRTLVFIETTQYFTSNSSGWRVQIWRVTFFGPDIFGPAIERLARVPAAHST